MAGKASRRSAPGVALFMAAVAMLIASGLVLSAGSPARAAPRPPRPNAVTISGSGLPRPVTVRADADPRLFTALLDQVSWLTGAGHGTKPAAALGPKYTVSVLVNDAAVQTYELYPLASGGPRAYRPARQPGKRVVTAAWFFGRLTMPEALQAAGVPLPGRPSVITGGIGGGERAVPEPTREAGRDFGEVLDELRGLLLLNVAVIVLITVGLAGIALLVHRHTR